MDGGSEVKVGLGGSGWEAVERTVFLIVVVEVFWGAAEDDVTIFSGGSKGEGSFGVKEEISGALDGLKDSLEEDIRGTEGSAIEELEAVSEILGR